MTVVTDFLTTGLYRAGFALLILCVLLVIGVILVVALARYGGLRCPSEIALLKWSDIHWDAERMTVTSPKTKRYGKATRVVPIFRR